MENVETVIKRPRIPVWIYIVALVLIIAIAAGIYFIFIAGGKKGPMRGTYVFNGYKEVVMLEQGHQQT